MVEPLLVFNGDLHRPERATASESTASHPERSLSVIAMSILQHAFPTRAVRYSPVRLNERETTGLPTLAGRAD